VHPSLLSHLEVIPAVGCTGRKHTPRRVIFGGANICRLNVLSSTYWGSQTNSPILVGEDYARVDALVVDAFVDAFVVLMNLLLTSNRDGGIRRAPKIGAASLC